MKKTQQQQKQDSVRVCIRMRPLLQHEDAEFWETDPPTNRIFTTNAYETRDLLSDYSLQNIPNKDVKRALMDSIYSPQSFTFDKIYPITSNTQIIYKEMCREITKSVINGFNGSIFMYGQTTSGKTFTMLGSPNSPGILPCALRDVFNMISKEPQPDNFTVYCSYVEIYNENIHDLLTDANYLKLIDDNKYGVVVAGAKRVKINNFEDGIGIKDFGEENRKYRETLINEYSSRSHTIFQIFIESIELTQNDDDDNIDYAKSRFSCLNLIDLAGSERIGEYDPNKEGSGETGYINKSLFVLANVINRLADNTSTGKRNHIPYRDSKLTRLLSQALGGNSLTAIICTVSPAAVNYYQTLSTLRFAMRAKNVKLKPIANEYLDDKGKLEYYKNEIRKLQNELKNKNRLHHNLMLDSGEVGSNNNGATFMYKSNSQANVYDGGDGYNHEMYEKIMKTNENLNNELMNYKQLYQSEKAKCENYKNELERLRGRGTSAANTIEDYSNMGYVHYNNPTPNNATLSPHRELTEGVVGYEIDNLISQLSLSHNKQVSSSQWKDETNKISNDYKNELETLKNTYISKINKLHSTMITKGGAGNLKSDNGNINMNVNMNANGNDDRSRGINTNQNEQVIEERNVGNEGNEEMNQEIENRDGDDGVDGDNFNGNERDDNDDDNNNEIKKEFENDFKEGVNNNNNNFNRIGMNDNNNGQYQYQNLYLDNKNIVPNLNDPNQYSLPVISPTNNNNNNNFHNSNNINNNNFNPITSTNSNNLNNNNNNNFHTFDNPNYTNPNNTNPLNSSNPFHQSGPSKSPSATKSNTIPTSTNKQMHLPNYQSQSSNDEIIDKIILGKIFDSIALNYLPKSNEGFEDNVKTLKKTYETKVDTLEKTMDYYKSYIENYYRKKIQQTRNTNMDSVELIEGNLPIMQITSEHNEMLKKLRELYQKKMKDLETNFFATLRTITAKRMDDMNSGK